MSNTPRKTSIYTLTIYPDSPPDDQGWDKLIEAVADSLPNRSRISGTWFRRATSEQPAYFAIGYRHETDDESALDLLRGAIIRLGGGFTGELHTGFAAHKRYIARDVRAERTA